MSDDDRYSIEVVPGVVEGDLAAPAAADRGILPLADRDRGEAGQWQ